MRVVPQLSPHLPSGQRNNLRSGLVLDHDREGLSWSQPYSVEVIWAVNYLWSELWEFGEALWLSGSFRLLASSRLGCNTLAQQVIGHSIISNPQLSGWKTGFFMFCNGKTILYVYHSWFLWSSAGARIFGLCSQQALKV